MRGLRHPHIVQVFEWLPFSDKCVTDIIVMDYVCITPLRFVFHVSCCRPSDEELVFQFHCFDEEYLEGGDFWKQLYWPSVPPCPGLTGAWKALGDAMRGLAPIACTVHARGVLIEFLVLMMLVCTLLVFIVRYTSTSLNEFCTVTSRRTISCVLFALSAISKWVSTRLASAFTQFNEIWCVRSFLIRPSAFPLVASTVG